MLNTTPRRVLLTGASHGIGRRTAVHLGRRGWKLVLVGRTARQLDVAAAEVAESGGTALPLVADLTDPIARARLVPEAIDLLGGLDVLVNVAGSASFKTFESETAADLAQLLTLNVLAPMELSRAAVAHFMRAGSGQVVNVGSIFGSIGFPHFTAYSATKFALRGFSEALRREVAGHGIDVTYVAPRAVRTRLAERFAAMAEATKMPLDDPDQVAARIAAAIEGRKKDVYLGSAEPVFVRLNALLPRLVDRLLRRQTASTRVFAAEAQPAPSASRGETATHGAHGMASGPPAAGPVAGGRGNASHVAGSTSAQPKSPSLAPSRK